MGIRFRKVTGDLLDKIREFRRDLHAHPELGHHEFRTRERVAKTLQEAGVEVLLSDSHTGVIGLIRGKERGGKTVALRADMDALPIREATGVPHASRCEAMHACGHDGHTAILLGAGLLLAANREKIKGTVKLVFQPAEEGVTGALRIREDFFARPRPEGVFALHSWPEGLVGEIGVWMGTVTAASDALSITVEGRGTHAASPHRGTDSILAAARVIEALHTLIGREIDPLEAAVLTLGTVHGGDAINVIPARVEIGGTLRTHDEAVREKLRKRIREAARDSARCVGAKARVRITPGARAVINDREMAELVLRVGREIPSVTEARELKRPLMVAEDFSVYQEGIPGAYFFLGIGDPKGKPCPPLHHPCFDFNDEALEPGILMMAGIAARFLDPRG